MVATPSRIAARPAPLTPGDLAAVQVELGGARGARERLGTAADALRDRRLTDAERAAVEALVRAVRLLRSRAGFAGADDAVRAVRLVLRDPDATTGGPWATTGSVAVGSRNGLATQAPGRARPNVLLTVDAAVHELAHVAQFALIPANATPHPALLEGIADTVAMLATGDDTLGEGFFHDDSSGRPRGAIRELGTPRTSGPTLGGVIRRYADAIAPGAEEHAAGGVVSATFAEVRRRLGRARAERLVWTVIRDPQAWRTGGTWRDLALAIQRGTTSLWPGDPAAASAAQAALAATGLDAALR